MSLVETQPSEQEFVDSVTNTAQTLDKKKKGCCCRKEKRDSSCFEILFDFWDEDTCEACITCYYEDTCPDMCPED